jgi:hypothetical protein
MADEQLDSLKLPPHSIEAEQSVIGGLLLENEALDKIFISTIIKPYSNTLASLLSITVPLIL